MSALSEDDFHYLAREIRARIGIRFAPDKANMIEMRLTPVSRREGFLGVQEMITTARARQDDRLLWAIADALIINETTFFRDRPIFTALRDEILPLLARSRAPARVRILSAACSTGQEPYSLAMLIDEMRLAGRGVDCEVVAFDVSERALDKARAGLFSQFEVQRGLPIALLIRHFEKIGELWRVSDRVRAAVKFQRANLIEDISGLGDFDVIMCRNVLSYFDAEARQDALETMCAMLAPDGYLFLGAAESAGAGFAPARHGPGAFAPIARREAA